MKNMNTYIFGAACVALSGAIAYVTYKKTESMREDILREAQYDREKLKNVMERIDIQVNNLSDVAEVSVDDAIVKKAVNTAVDREVNRVVRATAQEAVNAVRSDISAHVSTTIHAQYTDISKAVKDTVTAQVAVLDISSIKKTALSEARDEFRSDFKEVLREIKKDAGDDVKEALEDIKKDAEKKTESMLSNYETTMRLTQAIKSATDGSSNVVIL